MPAFFLLLFSRILFPFLADSIELSYLIYNGLDNYLENLLFFCTFALSKKGSVIR